MLWIAFNIFTPECSFKVVLRLKNKQYILEIQYNKRLCSSNMLSNSSLSNKSQKIKHYYPLLSGSNIFYDVVSAKQDT